MDSIKLGSDIVFMIGPVPFTNSVVAGFLCSLILIAGALWVRRGAGIIPTRRQVGAEMVMGFLEDGVYDAFGGAKRGNIMFFVFLTIFLFLIVANQLSLLPLINQITTAARVGEGVVPILRTPTADLSLPLALSIVLMLGGHVWAFVVHPVKYIGNYVRIAEIFKVKKFGDLPMALIEVFLGFMDVIGEAAKIVSLSARLFGNLFAGEVMYVVLTGLVAFIVPMPIIALGIVSGLVQAFVFTSLAYQFMGGTVRSVD